MKFSKLLIFYIIASSVICGMAVLKIYNLRSSCYDLALFDWNFWSIANLGEWQRAFYGHVQPMMFIWALIYKIYGNPYLLVILQGIILCSPILFFNKIIEINPSVKEYGWLILIGYILYFPIWYNALFDFHIDHLVIPLGLLFYIACQYKKWVWCIVISMAICMVKEPYALMTMGFGSYLFLRTILTYKKYGYSFNTWFAYQKGAILTGTIIIVGGYAYLNTALCVISPYFTHGNWIGLDSPAYSWMGNGFQQMALFLIKNPLAIIIEIFGTPRKIFYIICVFGGLAFLPFLAPLELIPAVPVLAISLLSRVDNYYGIGHHYTAGLVSALIAGFIVGMPRFYKIAEKLNIHKKVCTAFIACTILIFHILLSPSPISRLFWSNKIWKYGVDAYLTADRNEIIKKAIKKNIPYGFGKAVSAQNTIYTSYLSRRITPLIFPSGVFGKIRIPDFRKDTNCNNISAEYIVIDLKRPWFIQDKGCDWQYQGCKDTTMSQEFLRLVEIAKTNYETIYEYDGFFILHQSLSEKKDK